MREKANLEHLNQLQYVLEVKSKRVMKFALAWGSE